MIASLFVGVKREKRTKPSPSKTTNGKTYTMLNEDDGKGNAEEGGVDVDAAIRGMIDVDSFFSASEKWKDDTQSGVGTTSSQREKLLTIQQRKNAFETVIEGLGKGVDDIRDLGIQQNEEVKMQNLMLNDMTLRMSDVQHKLKFVNARMKGVLAQMGRGGDKLCLDLVCIILALGLAGVMYKMIDSGSIELNDIV
jgi:hypothetical protein